MNRSLEPLSVRTTIEGKIEISQPGIPGEGRDDMIIISPEQVDLLAAWLQEAKSELAAVVPSTSSADRDGLPSGAGAR